MRSVRHSFSAMFGVSNSGSFDVDAMGSCEDIFGIDFRSLHMVSSKGEVYLYLCIVTTAHFSDQLMVA